MAITAIKRYFVGNPNLVSIVTDDDLTAITTTGYWDLPETVDSVAALTNGTWEWTDTDLVVIYYSAAQIGFFVYDSANATFDALNPSGGLSNTLQDGDIFVGNSSNVATGVSPSGDITLTNAGVFGIAAGAIVNADVNAAAAIAFSKLAALPSAEILVGSAGNVPTAVAMTGDIAITNTGVTSIQAGAIVNADINASAAIAFSKLATLTDGNILVGSGANVATSVAVTGDVTISNAGVTAIASGVIVNADVNAAAAIDFSKLAALPSAQILVGSAGNVAAAVAMSGDVAISNTGATTIQAGAVELGMLASAISPAYVVKFAGQPTTAGGGAAEAITVTGAAATDLAFVQMVDDGTNNVTIVNAVVTLNTLTVTFSGDPGNDCVINYQIIRATS